MRSFNYELSGLLLLLKFNSQTRGQSIDKVEICCDCCGVMNRAVGKAYVAQPFNILLDNIFRRECKLQGIIDQGALSLVEQGGVGIMFQSGQQFVVFC